MSSILNEVLSANQTYASTFGEKAKLALPPARFDPFAAAFPFAEPLRRAGGSAGTSSGSTSLPSLST